jgi:hypothetical protein
MFDLALPTLAFGTMHFVIGGLWYSPLGFSAVWMRGLGVTQADIAEARINVRAALAASALASVAQTAVLIWLLQQIGDVGVVKGALTGMGIAFAFSFLPMLKDRVWADRAWSVILVDAGYEITAAALVGGLAAWWMA